MSLVLLAYSSSYLLTVPVPLPFSSNSVSSVGGTLDIPATAAPFSAGGFSNRFPAPAFQLASTATYLLRLANANVEGQELREYIQLELFWP
jgi:tripeptidyl-peptidase I